MKFEQVNKIHSWKAWKTAEGKWEVKAKDRYGDSLFHLSEDEDAEEDRIESGKFYLNVQHAPSGLEWIRERKGIQMGGGIVDADYVVIKQNGESYERQHNHQHLDKDVENGLTVALTPV